ncbi:hypothetical protein [Chitinophaga vietnamensis]|uniref:hypothetical protein n=1 Tax=Chitinophaga vietnamensis TaxID=2593957 RepID=UPI0011786220|nr:hypothetical protein [Chitinophaga vietnamensis]
MRNLKYCFTAAALIISMGSCVTYQTQGGNPHGLPPGQAKKIYGTQSAKPFAPGQQKKQYNY